MFQPFPSIESVHPMKNRKNLVQKLLPYPALILTLILDIAIPESPRQVAAGKPYFQYLVSTILVI